MATLTQTATRTPVPAYAAQTLSQPQSAIPLSEQGTFAFAQIRDGFHLVQIDPAVANSKHLFLTPVTVAIFRHEFGVSFRYVRHETLSPAEVQILQTLDTANLLCDDNTGVVFLSSEMRNQLLSYTARLGSAARVRRRY